MTEIIDFGDGVVLEIDPETGEVVTDIAPGSQLLYAIAQKRHYAKAEEDAWGQAKHALDAVLLRQQDEKTAAYGDISIRAMRDQAYASQDVEAFADMVFERWGTAFAHDPAAQDAVKAVLAILGASKGYKRDTLPEAARELLDRVTEWKAKRSWIESSVVRQPAPRRKAVADA